MAKPPPKPQRPQSPPPQPAQSQPPLWKQPRPVAIATGGLLGLIALGVGAQQLFTGGSGNGSQNLEQWVDAYLESDRKESAADRHADPDKRVRQLVEVMGAPGFGKLPQAKQDAIRNRHRELRDYQEYQAALEKIDDPRDARTDEQLKKIRAALAGVRAPPEYLAEWAGTPARDRHNEWLADAEALAKAVQDVAQGYAALARAGQQVLDTASAANLPMRAKEVLDRARELPDPQGSRAALIPGSRRVTYAAVFGFADASAAHTRWQRVRKTLEDLAGLRKP